MENKDDRFVNGDKDPFNHHQGAQEEPESRKDEELEMMMEENLHEFYDGQGQDYLDLNEPDDFQDDKKEDSSEVKEPVYATAEFLEEKDEAIPIQQEIMPQIAEENRFQQSIPIYESGKDKKKKKSLQKKVVAVAGSLVAVTLIAFSSIGVYTLFFEDDSADTASTEESSVVQQTSNEEGLTISEIAAKVTPSVVGINVESMMESGTGTGIIMSEDGYIITNAHVVSGMTKITVVLMDETEYEATLIGSDTQSDLALLKIDATGLTPAEFGDSDDLVIGAEVVAIGNPLGMDFAGTVSDGIVSGLNREVEIDGQVMNYIQTNASINSGNSGGPLVNSQGQVVGINSAKISSAIAEGMGFSIPINDALPILEELKENGYISGRPQIGIGGQDIDEDTANYYNVPSGVLVQEISENSGAEDAGIQIGDIITAINGTEIASIAELNEIKNELSPGDSIKLTVYRDGQTTNVNVVLTEQDSQ